MADSAFREQNTTTNDHIYTLEQIFGAALALGYPVAVWQLPETTTVQACISFDAVFQVDEPNLEVSPFGFLFCPFIPGTDQPNLFIKADVVYTATTRELEFATHVSVATKETFTRFLQQYEEQKPKNWYVSAAISISPAQPEINYKTAVAAAITAIQQEQMEKVVLSRSKLEELPASFNPLAAFKSMLPSYPRAFVSLVSVPGAGTWLGASPEILVSIDRQQIFRTVALAGTQPANDETNLANAIWRQKEIEEQGMVERYILSCFKKLRLREYSEVGPRTVVAGNLMHLRTDFKVDLNEVDFPTLGTDMLHLLHPTSAICGLPKEPALKFISEHEGYNRSYYSGFLGPVNSTTGTHIYVNLRCMQLLSDKAILYAGAGITADSVPEKEYQETQYKMLTMRKILSDF